MKKCCKNCESLFKINKEDGKILWEKNIAANIDAVYVFNNKVYAAISENNGGLNCQDVITDSHKNPPGCITLLYDIIVLDLDGNIVPDECIKISPQAIRPRDKDDNNYIVSSYGVSITDLYVFNEGKDLYIIGESRSRIFQIVNGKVRMVQPKFGKNRGLYNDRFYDFIAGDFIENPNNTKKLYKVYIENNRIIYENYPLFGDFYKPADLPNAPDIISLNEELKTFGDNTYRYSTNKFKNKISFTFDFPLDEIVFEMSLFESHSIPYSATSSGYFQTSITDTNSSHSDVIMREKQPTPPPFHVYRLNLLSFDYEFIPFISSENHTSLRGMIDKNEIDNKPLACNFGTDRDIFERKQTSYYGPRFTIMRLSGITKVVDNIKAVSAFQRAIHDGTTGDFLFNQYEYTYPFTYDSFWVFTTGLGGGGWTLNFKNADWYIMGYYDVLKYFHINEISHPSDILFCKLTSYSFTQTGESYVSEDGSLCIDAIMTGNWTIYADINIHFNYGAHYPTYITPCLNTYTNTKVIIKFDSENKIYSVVKNDNVDYRDYNVDLFVLSHVDNTIGFDSYKLNPERVTYFWAPSIRIGYLDSYWIDVVREGGLVETFGPFYHFINYPSGPMSEPPLGYPTNELVLGYTADIYYSSNGKLSDYHARNDRNIQNLSEIRNMYQSFGYFNQLNGSLFYSSYLSVMPSNYYNRAKVISNNNDFSTRNDKELQTDKSIYIPNLTFTNPNRPNVMLLKIVSSRIKNSDLYTYDLSLRNSKYSGDIDIYIVGSTVKYTVNTNTTTAEDIVALFNENGYSFTPLNYNTLSNGKISFYGNVNNIITEIPTFDTFKEYQYVHKYELRGENYGANHHNQIYLYWDMRVEELHPEDWGFPATRIVWRYIVIGNHVIQYSESLYFHLFYKRIQDIYYWGEIWYEIFERFNKDIFDGNDYGPLTAKRRKEDLERMMQVARFLIGSGYNGEYSETIPGHIHSEVIVGSNNPSHHKDVKHVLNSNGVKFYNTSFNNNVLNIRSSPEIILRDSENKDCNYLFFQTLDGQTKLDIKSRIIDDWCYYAIYYNYQYRYQDVEDGELTIELKNGVQYKLHPNEITTEVIVNILREHFTNIQLLNNTHIINGPLLFRCKIGGIIVNPPTTDESGKYIVTTPYEFNRINMIKLNDDNVVYYDRLSMDSKFITDYTKDNNYSTYPDSLSPTDAAQTDKHIYLSTKLHKTIPLKFYTAREAGTMRIDNEGFTNNCYDFGNDDINRIVLTPEKNNVRE